MGVHGIGPGFGIGVVEIGSFVGHSPGHPGYPGHRYSLPFCPGFDLHAPFCGGPLIRARELALALSVVGLPQQPFQLRSRRPEVRSTVDAQCYTIGGLDMPFLE